MRYVFCSWQDDALPVGGRVPLCLHLCLLPLVACTVRCCSVSRLLWSVSVLADALASGLTTLLGERCLSGANAGLCARSAVEPGLVSLFPFLLCARKVCACCAGPAAPGFWYALRLAAFRIIFSEMYGFGVLLP